MLQTPQRCHNSLIPASMAEDPRMTFAETHLVFAECIFKGWKSLAAISNVKQSRWRRLFFHRKPLGVHNSSNIMDGLIWNFCAWMSQRIWLIVSIYEFSAEVLTSAVVSIFALHWSGAWCFPIGCLFSSNFGGYHMTQLLPTVQFHSIQYLTLDEIPPW